MTHVGSAPVESVSATEAPGFLDWGAIGAGAVLAAAISFVLLMFGTAIGLSATSPWPNSGLSAKVIASLAVFWTMAQQIGAFMVGGYVAGRLRPRRAGSSQDEVEFRDGLHGGLVWAIGIVIGAALLLASAGAATRSGLDAVGKSASAAASSSEVMDTVIDTMLRPMSLAQASAPSSQPPSAAAPPSGAGSRPPNAVTAETRAEMARILAAALANGSLTDQNRTYLARLVAQRSGLSEQEAEKRVNDALNAAREAADKARKAAILIGFVTAASLIISFGAAWWAAQRGGHHRDNSIPARFELGRRRGVGTVPR